MEESLLSYLIDVVGPVGLVIASGLGALVVIGQAVVAITPSEKDNELMAKLYAIPVLGGVLKALEKFAPIQKRDKK